ncbi:hypothetical protein [Microbacterium gorillae]|uniref:hypothetical protein n=1 Tax=Microbacterium gorillae TaxID=1231063 RepID=UPI000A79F06E|nr:hypothetical protein [Microbacterium gorillae]
MALARRSDLGPLADEVQRLRGQIDSMQRRRADTAVVPVAPELTALFPDGGLRPGSTYAVESSTSLLLALLSEPSRAGSWCAVLGLPTLGAEAAAGYGVVLDRLALVPDPGDRWVSVAAALAEVVPVIAVRPPARPHDAEVARLSARLRDRGGVLLILGDWAGADVALRLSDAHWSGTEHGAGVLRSRSVEVSARARRSPGARRVRVQLPGPSGALQARPQRTLTPVPTPATDELSRRRAARALAGVS